MLKLQLSLHHVESVDPKSGQHALRRREDPARHLAVQEPRRKITVWGNRTIGPELPAQESQRVATSILSDSTSRMATGAPISPPSILRLAS